MVTGGLGDAPVQLTGGVVEVNWSIEDLCDTIGREATFTVVTGDSIIYPEPSDTTVMACNLGDQTALDIVFEDWLSEQTELIEDGIIGSGCDPMIERSPIPSPVLCDGGEFTISWTISDLHTSTEVLEAIFTLIAPDEITPAVVTDTTVFACDHLDQQSLDDLYAVWVQSKKYRVRDKYRV